MAGQVTIWENANFGGRSDTFNATTGQLNGWEYKSASSVRLTGFGDGDWTAFFETPDNFGDDTLYLQGNGELANLANVERPHGSNNWNDIISQIQFGLGPNPGAPVTIENSTELDHGTRRYRVGNKGWWQLDNSNPGWGDGSTETRPGK
jgi:hypothetical protein